MYKRVFSPLREHIKEKEVAFPEEEKSKKWTFSATQFFKGEGKPLTAGPMVGIFTDVFMKKERLGEKPDHPAYALIWDYLMQLPRGSLIIPDESVRESRKKALFDIAEFRNKCAHTSPDRSDLSPDNIRKSWQYLAEDEDAFLRYFIGAHLKN